jgi:hypothetical protein
VHDAVVEALRAGYRHIDAAAVYGNEQEVRVAPCLHVRRPPVMRLSKRVWVRVLFLALDRVDYAAWPASPGVAIVCSPGVDVPQAWRPSQLAAAAFGRGGVWPSGLLHHTGFAGVSNAALPALKCQSTVLVLDCLGDHQSPG